MIRGPLAGGAFRGSGSIVCLPAVAAASRIRELRVDLLCRLGDSEAIRSALARGAWGRSELDAVDPRALCLRISSERGHGDLARDLWRSATWRSRCKVPIRSRWYCDSRFRSDWIRRVPRAFKAALACSIQPTSENRAGISNLAALSWRSSARQGGIGPSWKDLTDSPLVHSGQHWWIPPVALADELSSAPRCPRRSWPNRATCAGSSALGGRAGRANFSRPMTLEEGRGWRCRWHCGANPRSMACGCSETSMKPSGPTRRSQPGWRASRTEVPVTPGSKLDLASHGGAIR